MVCFLNLFEIFWAIWQMQSLDIQDCHIISPLEFIELRGALNKLQ